MTYSQQQKAHIKSTCSPIDIEENYKNTLDEIWGEVTVAGFKFDTSNALETLDPIAFRCGVADHYSYLLDGDQYVEIDGELYDEQEVELEVEAFDEENDGSSLAQSKREEHL